MSKKLTQEEFIKKVKSIHGDEIDLSETVYIGSKIKCKFKCKVHGIFFAQPNSIISSKTGCPICYGSVLKTIEQVIKEFTQVHGNAWNYDEVDYRGCHKKVAIKCKVHGIFWQKPYAHLVGQGCPKCSGFNKTTEEVIKEFILVHGLFYDYSKFVFENCYKKGIIICPIHGEFLQNHSSHINGAGCPKCCHNISKPEVEWLNSIELSENIIINRQYKIRLNNKTYHVDGYYEENNTVYEFNGDYWHGNPVKYDQNKINKMNKLSFGELYKRTIDKQDLLRQNGYNVISIWESDYRAFNILNEW